MKLTLSICYCKEEEEERLYPQQKFDAHLNTHTFPLLNKKEDVLIDSPKPFTKNQYDVNIRETKYLDGDGGIQSMLHTNEEVLMYAHISMCLHVVMPFHIQRTMKPLKMSLKCQSTQMPKKQL